MSDIEIGWLAAMIDCEGTIAERGRIAIEMTDLDLIERLRRVTGEGRIYGPRERGADRKPIWVWTVQDRSGVERLFRIIYPHLGSRRKGQVDVALAAFKDRKPRPRRLGRVGGGQGSLIT